MEENKTFDAIIFEKKSFSDLLKDIYKNSKQKEKQISILIEELRPFIKNIGDASVIVPIIKDYLDVGVKNDELLVKIAAIVQRALQSKDSSNATSGFGDISQDELDDLEAKYSAVKNKPIKSVATNNPAINTILDEASKLSAEKSTEETV